MYSFDEIKSLYVRQYMAVSYCWRFKDFGTERPEDKPYGEWPVSQRFIDAIISEKDHPRVGIWMDQLCIDQTSWIDKQKSVVATDIIYRSCVRLLVLLEDIPLNEEKAALADKFTFTNVKFDNFPETIPSTKPQTHGMPPKIMTTARLSDADNNKPRRTFLDRCIDNGPTFTARLWA